MSESSALLADVRNKELLYLVQTEGWAYAQLMAGEIQKEFECRPGEPGWQTLTTIQYALNQLIGRVRRGAEQARAKETALPSQSITAEIKKQDADRTSRGPDASKRRTTARGRRLSAG